ncbi:conserved protein of unknown function [Pararobbsia alpina]
MKVEPVQTLEARCRDCVHRASDRAGLESLIPGLSSLGSAFGASVGESRLCRIHDRLVSPDDHCGQFTPARL